MFGKNFPKVEKGSTIVIPKKPTKTKKEAKKGNPATFYKALNATIATTTSVVTLLVLILTLTKK